MIVSGLAVAIREITMHHHGRAQLDRPFILLSIDAPAGSQGPPPAAYICRVVFSSAGQ